MKGSEVIVEGLMRNRTAAEHVFDLLRRDIITGRARPGQRLVERELTERFGVSRTPVREALRHLVNAQLAVNVPYRGIMVRTLSSDFARDVYELRLGLEGLAAKLAAERGSDEDLRRLERIFHRIEQRTEEGNREEAMLLNNEFHRVIAEAAGNELLSTRVEEIWTTVNLVRGSAWRNTMRPALSRDEHKKILDAILQRDPLLAREVSEDHILRSWELVEKSLVEEGE